MVLSEIDNIWSGDFMRKERKKWPELFLYSKKDFYLPWQYMEETIDQRQKDGREVVAKCFDRSKHVSHLPGNKKEYVAAVHNFLELAYFSKLPLTKLESTTTEPIKVVEIEEEVEDTRRASTA